jgi:hypothetical protein
MLGSVDVHMLCRLVLQKANLLAVCPDLLNSPSGGLHQQEYASTSTDATTSYFITTLSLLALHQKLPSLSNTPHERKQHIGPAFQPSFKHRRYPSGTKWRHASINLQA